MNLPSAIAIYANSHPIARACIKLVGFSHSQEEQIRQVLSEIPSQCLKHIKVIKATPSLGAKHGRYMGIKLGVIHLNPHDFSSRVKFGQGPGRKLPHVDLTLAHEIGHGVFLSLSPEQQKEWKAISGWKEGSGEGQAAPYKEKRPGWPKETSTETHREGAKFTRHYAERNSDEDFADSFGFYALGQKSRVPQEKLAFLEKVLR